MRLCMLVSHVSDNRFVLFEGESGATRWAVAVDPIDAAQVIARLEQDGRDLLAILNTHWHPDHVQGNAALLDRWPGASVLAGQGDALAIERLTQRPVHQRLEDGQDLELAWGQLQLRVLATPGHTAGHISLLWRQEHLLCGDTIFSAGVGNCRFGGDPGQLYRTLTRVIDALPQATRLYPGHDYATRNLELAAHVLPEDPAIAQALAAARARPSDALTVTTLGQERGYNLFLRTQEPALRQRLQERWPDLWRQQLSLAQDDPDEAAWRALRALRDDW